MKIVKLCLRLRVLTVRDYLNLSTAFHKYGDVF